MRENDGKLTLNSIPNLDELIEHDVGKELRVLVKKDPNDSQSEYETSENDQTPKMPAEKPALVVPKKEKTDEYEKEPIFETPKKPKRKRASSGNLKKVKNEDGIEVTEKPKSKKRKRTSSTKSDGQPEAKRRKKTKE